MKRERKEPPPAFGWTWCYPNGEIDPYAIEDSRKLVCDHMGFSAGKPISIAIIPRTKHRHAMRLEELCKEWSKATTWDERNRLGTRIRIEVEQERKESGR